MNGKEIIPVDIWSNGNFIACNWLIITLVFDDLSNVARFYYQIGFYDVNNGFMNVNDGNSIITGTEYENWGNSQDINNEAYILISQNLNLQLL